MIQTWSKTLKSQIVDSVARITKTGRSIGATTNQKTWSGLAPSTSAASIRSRGTCDSPALSVITTNGSAPQTTTTVITAKPSSGLANQLWWM